jgi:cobalt-zinc-cadmium efflux system protein
MQDHPHAPRHDESSVDSGRRHDHHHHHNHFGAAAEGFNRAFLIGIGLNLSFVGAETVYGFISGSVALIADAGHNMGDVLGLLAAWGASRLATRRPSARFTYGFRSSSMLAALFNAVLLLLVTGAIAYESVRRLFEPGVVAGPTVMVIAAIGIAVNGATAALFASGRKGDLNLRGAFLHMTSDALVSAGVVVAGAMIWITGWTLIDPLVSLVISGLIVLSTWGLLREALWMVLQAVPEAIRPEDVKAALLDMPGVQGLHDLHIWSMSTTETALTCHLVMPDGHPGDPFLNAARRMLKDRYRIGHATLQVELNEQCECPLHSVAA